MAAITTRGFVGLDALLEPNVALSVNLDALGPPQGSPPLDTPEVDWGDYATALANNTPIAQPAQGVTIYNGQSFLEDYYYRIIIRPNPVDLGFIVNDQQVAVEVFNAYFVSKTLENIVAANAEGLTLLGPTLPRTWDALESVQYQLSVTPDGPAILDAQFMFDWTGTVDDNLLRVLGTRLVAFPYIFGAPCKEVLEWKTDVITANDGSEQRIRLRKKPRQSLSASYPVPYVELPRAQNLLYGWVHRRWAIPLWNEAQNVGPLGVGATEILLDTTNVDIRPDSLIYVYDTARNAAALDIGEVEADRVHLKRPLANAYGSAWVMPARLGRVTNNPNRATTGYNGDVGLDYEFSDNIDLNPPAAPVQYLGYDVDFEEVLLSGAELQDTIQRRVDEVDYGMADAAATFSPWLFTRIGRPHRFVLQGLPAIWAFRRWLHRRCGRLRPFWQPTFENDLRLAQDVTVTNSLTVYDDDYKAFAADRSHLAIQLIDGSWMLRSVTATSTPSPGFTLLGLSSALNVEPTTIARICFLGLKRLDTDRVELKWNTNRIVETTIRLMEILP